MSKTTIILKHFALGGRASLETIVNDLSNQSDFDRFYILQLDIKNK